MTLTEYYERIKELKKDLPELVVIRRRKVSPKDKDAQPIEVHQDIAAKLIVQGHMEQVPDAEAKAYREKLVAEFGKALKQASRTRSGDQPPLTITHPEDQVLADQFLAETEDD
jgi:hypothetical protein